jgi:hypothetical protein
VLGLEGPPLGLSTWVSFDGNRPWTLSMKRRVSGCGRVERQPVSLSRGSFCS